MEMGLQGQRVVVTGAASGIGLATARAFLAEGSSVMICDTDAQALADLASTDPSLLSARCDVSDRAEVGKFFEEALERFGGLDTLVNNAGIAGPTGPVDEIAPEDWDHCLSVCLTGQFNCTRLAVEALKASTNNDLEAQLALEARLQGVCDTLV